jgi:RES domain-containing protein
LSDVGGRRPIRIAFFVRVRPVTTDRRCDPGGLPVRVVSGIFWRHCSPACAALGLPERALSSARWHRKGQQPRLYACSSPEAAWGELFRHVPAGLSRFEVGRRMAKLEVSALPVLDLTDAGVRRRLGVTRQELVGARCQACQAIATLLRERPDRFGGILAPLPARPQEHALVVFAEWCDGHVRVLSSRIACPPRASRTSSSR